MFKKLFVISSLVFLLAIGTAAVSPQPGWVNLGEKEVTDKSEKDTWHIGKGKGEFRKLKLAVLERAVRIYRAEVKYENGRIQKLEIRNQIPAGGESRAIDLTGTERFIDKVDIWYEANTAGQGKRSHVILYGLK